MTHHQYTFPEARSVVLCTCEDFIENLPADLIPEDYAVEVQELVFKLCHYLGREVKAYDVEGLVNRLAEFAELESGTHEDLIQTANGAIDEGGMVRDRLNSQLRDDLYFTVTDAGIDATREEVAA